MPEFSLETLTFGDNCGWGARREESFKMFTAKGGDFIDTPDRTALLGDTYPLIDRDRNQHMETGQAEASKADDKTGTQKPRHSTVNFSARRLPCSPEGLAVSTAVF